MVYESSLQEQRYLTTVRNEKEAFEALIKFKASMVISADQVSACCTAWSCVAMYWLGVWGV